MKLHYYPETDSLYIELKSTPGAEAREIVAGLVVDLDANGEVVGFDSIMPPASSTCPKSRRSPFRRRAPWSDASSCYPQPVIAGHRYVVSRRRLGALTSHRTRAAPASPPPFTGEDREGACDNTHACARTPSPTLQPKSDLSDFGRLMVTELG